MSTLGQVRDRIADDLNRTDLSSQIDKAINRAIKYYEKERFWFNENSWSFTCTSSSEAVQFSSASVSDLLSIDVVRITRNSSDLYPLRRISYKEYRQKLTTGTTHVNVPVEYAVYNKTFYFYPVPDQNYTITVYGQKSYGELSQTSSSNDFTVDAEDLIEARARAWIYARVIKSPEQAAIAKAEENEALTALREKTANLISTGEIRPHD